MLLVVPKFVVLVVLLTTTCTSCAGNLDNIFCPPQTRKTRSLKPKNADYCRTETAGLGREILAQRREILAQGREILALKKEIETLKSSPTDDDGGGDESYGAPNDDDYAPILKCTKAGDDAYSTGSKLDCCDGRKTELKPCRTNDLCYICPPRQEITIENKTKYDAHPVLVFYTPDSSIDRFDCPIQSTHSIAAGCIWTNIYDDCLVQQISVVIQVYAGYQLECTLSPLPEPTTDLHFFLYVDDVLSKCCVRGQSQSEVGVVC